MERYAIIVAGGSGTRMGSLTPKQFLVLGDKPILMHAILAFLHATKDIKIIVVLPKPSIKEWKSLCDQYHFNLPVSVVEGGHSRSQSVQNGLATIDNPNSLVAIHDGVRPLVSKEIIELSFRMAEIHGNAIAATQLKESIRMQEGSDSKSLDRSKMRLIQTPQTFKTDLIKEAYQSCGNSPEFTDDASVAEKYGHKIHLFEGSYINIKITTPEDLIFAEAILASKK